MTDEPRQKQAKYRIRPTAGGRFSVERQIVCPYGLEWKAIAWRYSRYEAEDLIKAGAAHMKTPTLYFDENGEQLGDEPPAP